MANIPAGTLRDWNNGEIMSESDYEQEREILRVAINDNYMKILDRYTKEEIDNFLDSLKGTGYTNETLKGVSDLITNLLSDLDSSSEGDSGADLIKTSPIEGVQGSTVRQVLQELKYQINSAVTGTIPNGSIGPEKLSFAIASDDTTVTVTDPNNHFTATKLSGVLDELFTSADSVKTNIANAIGSPAVSTDTGSVLAGYINAEKTDLAANIGDGTGSSSLGYLVDRLITRLDELAVNVNSKGIPATTSDTLAQLITKVSQIDSISSSAKTDWINANNGILGS